MCCLALTRCWTRSFWRNGLTSQRSMSRHTGWETRKGLYFSRMRISTALMWRSFVWKRLAQAWIFWAWTRKNWTTRWTICTRRVWMWRISFPAWKAQNLSVACSASAKAWWSTRRIIPCMWENRWRLISKEGWFTGTCWRRRRQITAGTARRSRWKRCWSLALAIGEWRTIRLSGKANMPRKRFWFRRNIWISLSLRLALGILSWAVFRCVFRLIILDYWQEKTGSLL